jgi:hypothetical protein
MQGAEKALRTPLAKLFQAINQASRYAQLYIGYNKSNKSNQ